MKIRRPLTFDGASAADRKLTGVIASSPVFSNRRRPDHACVHHSSGTINIVGAEKILRT